MTKRDIFVLFSTLLLTVWGHGRMIDPPQRSSMWRAGFNVTANYDDHGLFCGGMTTQWGQNGGRCGECGDAYHLPRPRENDEGGLYGTGTIGKTFVQGQIATVIIDLTQSHMGHFEFKLCKKSSPDELTTQECLDKNLLLLADGSGTKFVLRNFTRGLYYPKVKLPKGINCDNCVLQWHYTAGNNWGKCEDGRTGIGCGPQETFVNCADIRILPKPKLLANIRRKDYLNEILKDEDN